jgi:hypothetical protein
MGAPTVAEEELELGHISSDRDSRDPGPVSSDDVPGGPSSGSPSPRGAVLARERVIDLIRAIDHLARQPARSQVNFRSRLTDLPEGNR